PPRLILANVWFAVKVSTLPSDASVSVPFISGKLRVLFAVIAGFEIVVANVDAGFLITIAEEPNFCVAVPKSFAIFWPANVVVDVGKVIVPVLRNVLPARFIWPPKIREFIVVAPVIVCVMLVPTNVLLAFGNFQISV